MKKMLGLQHAIKYRRHYYAIVALGLALICATPAAASTPDELSSKTVSAYGGGGGATASSFPLSYQIRVGMSLDHAAASPRFYGLGGGGEATLVLDRRIAVGARLDGIGMLGFGITDEISIGARALGGLLGKAELMLRNGDNKSPQALAHRTRIVVGAAGGVYRIGAIGGSVSRNISEEKKEGLSGIALGGRARGVAPQLGIEKGRIRISGLTHLIFTDEDFDPVFALELSFRLM